MSWNANIPQPGDLLSQSQSDLLNNFMALQTLIDINHVDFASGDQGKHKWVTFPVQGAIPPAGSGFLAGEIGLYNANYSVSTKNELFINKTNQLTVVQVPATASILSANSAPAALGAGYTYLPSGILLRWGTVLGVTGLATFTLGTSSTVGPVPTQILSIQLTPYDPSGGDVNFAVRLANVISNSQFNVYVSSRTNTGPSTGSYTYLVIGY
jgi:hypothetical protein